MDYLIVLALGVILGVALKNLGDDYIDRKEDDRRQYIRSLLKEATINRSDW